MFNVQRDRHNPLTSPHKNHAWHDIGTPNGCPVITPEGTLALVYRAIGSPDRLQHPTMSRSSVAIAYSQDRNFFEKHTQLVAPEADFDKLGCEDPRVTKIDDTYYIFYTGISEYPYKPEGIRSCVALSKDLKTIERRELVTPFNAKAMCLFPEKQNGKYTVMVSVNTDLPGKETIGIAQFENLDTLFDKTFWSEWYQELDKHALVLTRDDSDHAEVGATPIKTDKGWLMVYSHIKQYYTEHNKIFGIEAVLLDFDDPRKVLARTRYPFIVPEEVFDRYGYVKEVTFPTGVLVNGETLEVYYGASDTTTCRAILPLQDLINTMLEGDEPEIFIRVDGNPVLEPNSNKWEDRDVFNPAAIDIDGVVYIVYRAMSQDNTSVFGLAISKDGKKIDERLPEPIYVPRIDYEKKLGDPNGNSGCEDPRITRIGDLLYMCYTAYNGIQVPRIAMTHISVQDFVARKWDAWSMPVLISPDGIDDKDGCLLPEKVNGHYFFIHRLTHHICGDFIDDLTFETNELDRCIEMVHPRPGMWDGLKVGISGPPHLTEHGWLLFYHGVSEDKFYRVGAVLFDKDDPSYIKGRSAYPIFGPRMEYEQVGEIGRVVFPCGSVIRGDQVFLYYGGADRVVGIATASMKDIMKSVGISI